MGIPSLQLVLVVASIIEGPIHIVDRDGSRETLGAQVLGSDIVDINKPAGGP